MIDIFIPSYVLNGPLFKHSKQNQESLMEHILMQTKTLL